MSRVTNSSLKKRLKASGLKMPHGYQVIARKHKKKSAKTLRTNARTKKR